MKVTANSLRLKSVIIYENGLWMIMKPPEHTKPGKGGAYVQVEMRNIKTKTKTNIRFNSNDYIELAYLEKKPYQYLYNEGDNLVFMDKETFEQTNISKDLIEDKVVFLKDNMDVEIEFYLEDPLNIILPSTVVLEVVETEPVIKGATVTGSYKPAVLENGIRVTVPPYLTIGEKIIVKTEDSTYVERAK